MKISYITYGRLHLDSTGKPASNTASARYRILLPGEQLNRFGHTVHVHATNDEFWSEGRYAAIVGDIVVFSKSFDRRNELLAESFKQAGRRLVFDICDNHFDHPQHGPHFRRMVQLADVLVASTQTMAEIIRVTTGRTSVVIGDPVEGTRGAARFQPDGAMLKCLWFGHPINLDSMFASLPALQTAAARYPIDLNVVTAPIPGLTDQLNEWNCNHADGLRLRLTQWSPVNVQHGLQAADMVLIPSLTNSTKQVKSPNRLIESIWAGRLTLAYPLPSYLEFDGFSCLHENLGVALEVAMLAPNAHHERIVAGQQYIDTCYRPEHIARQWEQALSLAATCDPVRAISTGNLISPASDRRTAAS